MQNFFNQWLSRLYPSQDMSPLNVAGLKYLRLLLLTLRDFQLDNCQLRASALALYSLISVVPVMAMAFGIAKGFGFEKMLEKQLLQNIPGQEEGLLYIIEFARKLLENTKGGIVAGIGVVVLFWSVIKVLSNIEQSFNHIWKVREDRSLGRKFSDYLSIALIAPILVILASSLAVFITTQVTTITENTELLELFSPVILSLLKLLPYAIIWVLFSFMYIFMPNTEVSLLSGIVGGVVAGTMYQFVQIGYIYFQVKISNYNAIYGSFAALPFFIFWLQLSWLVVLLGAEISFHYQTMPTEQCNETCLAPTPYEHKLFALHIVHHIVRNFDRGRPPLTPEQIEKATQLPPLLVSVLLAELLRSGIISQTLLPTGEQVAYQPAQPLDRLHVNAVLNALDHQGGAPYIWPQDSALRPLDSILQEFEQLTTHSPANRLLKDLELSDGPAEPMPLKRHTEGS